ncbi:BatD family protein [Luteimonas sp. M1R5S18]|uniref:BatD family protein n=1 Tax=Luteimonas rhizosphaericola TaxID=3042024 RepID=A0ABT6JN91_9GAMM|nr:BatD family protein [Luteimonas rhizosphaericola]MDH5831975.1 BatD family protein [Luteimonas rhizosphaericola]
MTRIAAWLVAWTLALAAAAPTQAATRAWLDRDRIEVGETTTLNIETDQATAQMPAFAELVPDFVLSGHSSSRGTEVANGQVRARVLFAVALQPRREGLMTVPALRVGDESTAPLTLTVVPASTAPARAGQPVFIESEADTRSPWVQQSVGYTLRLYYATPLVSGQLDQPAPEGAALQRVGSDLQYSRELAGRRYTVVERRFVIIPERSGTLTIPGARFEGTGVGGFFDDMFGDGRRALQANGPPTILQVRAAPDAAPQPWLPLHGLELRYLATPQSLRAGEAATIDVELVADGASASQVPDLTLPAIDGAQVFPEPPQVDEAFERGRPRTRVTRRFAVVPTQAGTLRVAGPRLQWWDVRAGTARTATVPALELEVAPGDSAVAPVDDAAQAAFEAGRGDAATGDVRTWRWLAMAFALLWLGTLAWWLRERRTASAARPLSGADAVADAAPGGAPSTSARDLQRLLQTGDLGEVELALLRLASPPAPTLDALSERLDAAAQRAAIARLQEARWNAGDPAVARQALREAFVAGPRWRAAVAPDASERLLPPLYPGQRDVR